MEQNELIYIPFTIDDVEKMIVLLMDYLRFYEFEDFTPVIEKEEIEDLHEWFLEARNESLNPYEEEDDFDE